MADHAAAKALLEGQLAELQGRLGNLERDLAEPADPDWEERAVQAEDDEALDGQIVLARANITSIARALGRLADGSYGECLSCGAVIAAGRLEARPEAALCIDCASRD